MRTLVGQGLGFEGLEQFRGVDIGEWRATAGRKMRAGPQ